MAWILLFLAGLFEVGFTTAMKLSDGFTKLWPSVAFVVCAVSSFALLTAAIRTIPLGSAYAIWTGLGAVGTIVVGIVFFNESANAARLLFLAMIIAGVIGVKMTSKTLPVAAETEAGAVASLPEETGRDA